MRYYDLKIANQTGATTLHYTSYPAGLGGAPDPGALNVIFDFLAYPQATPMGGSTIRIEGIDPSILSNAKSFSGQIASLSGGMGRGLPLVSPAQAGLLAQGKIYQSFANWTGTQVDLNLVLMPSPYTIDNPGNIVLNWTAGTTLSNALTNTFNTAFPGYKVLINIADIVLSFDEKHVSSTLAGLASLLSDVTSTNVQIVVNGTTITVFDATYRPNAKQLAFTDFIGQPMWIEQATIQARTVLRGDIQIGDTLLMPSGYQNLPGFVQTTAAAIPSQLNYKSAMQGTFVVQAVRHIGNFRQPDGNAWCTVINAAAMNVAPVAQ